MRWSETRTDTLDERAKFRGQSGERIACKRLQIVERWRGALRPLHNLSSLDDGALAIR
jgi:hypothetical protein